MIGYSAKDAKDLDLGLLSKDMGALTESDVVLINMVGFCIMGDRDYLQDHTRYPGKG